MPKSKKKYDKNKEIIKVPGEDITIESSNDETTAFKDKATKNI